MCVLQNKQENIRKEYRKTNYNDKQNKKMKKGK